MVLDGVEEEPDEVDAGAGVDGTDAGVGAGEDEPEPASSFERLPERES